MMRLKCHKCSHQWQDEPEPNQAAVMCPECMALVPMHLATGGAPAAPPKVTGSVQEQQTVRIEKSRAPEPVPPTAPGIHEEKTVLNPRTGTGDYIAEVQTVIQGKASASPSASSPSPAPPQRTAPSAPLPAPFSAPPPKPQAQSHVLDEFQQTLMELEKTAPTAPTAPPPKPAAPAAAAAPSASNYPLPSASGSVEEASDAPTMPSNRPKPAPTPDSRPSQEVRRSASQSAGSSPGKMDLTGQMLGGYKISKKLGAGGMGAVFLARQVSLDRDVALKVLPSSMANNPELMMRFTREALSAAQLSHHNVIQVFDVGSEDDVHFIAMELVRGKSLRDLIKSEGKLSLDDAAAYVLQTARGLKYAHDLGIIHRDIKPDNLMINEHGVVKIADMGLAKVLSRAEKGGGVDMEDERLVAATGDLTMAEVAMGTPAYMPPEQARDASTVDARADQYSLGCTLYYLCAGKTPYEGKTAFDLITKHLNEPLTPLDVVVKNVPQQLNSIIVRMLEKEPASRYPDMADVIRDLEAYLGVATQAGEFKPREEHLAQFEQWQKEYYSAPALKLRSMAIPGFFALMLLATVVALAAKSWGLAGGFIGLAVLTPLANFIWDGITQKTFLFRRVRSVFFGMTMKGWAATVGMSIVTLIILYFFGWLWSWLGFAFLAVGLAVGYQFALVRKLRAERAPALQKTQEMMKSLRVRGVSEEALQDFACRFGGDHWEEFFEELFGYQDMLTMRAKWAKMEQVKPRKRFATWRDPIARWLDDIEAARKAYRERMTLEKAEKQRLKAKGVSEKEAEKQAEDMATQILATELLPQAAKAAPAAHAQVAKGPVRVHNITTFSPMLAFRIARFVLGVFVALVAVSQNPKLVQVNIPGFIQSMLTSVASLGYGGWIWAGVIGAALALSALSKRVFLPCLILFAAVVLVLAHKVLPLLGGASLPLSAQQLQMVVSWGMLALGGLAFGKMAYNSISGGRF